MFWVIAVRTPSPPSRVPSSQITRLPSLYLTLVPCFPFQALCGDSLRELKKAQRTLSSFSRDVVSHPKPSSSLILGISSNPVDYFILVIPTLALTIRSPTAALSSLPVRQPISLQSNHLSSETNNASPYLQTQARLAIKPSFPHHYLLQIPSFTHPSTSPPSPDANTARNPLEWFYRVERV